ncbi:cysteine hydrolase [Micromonospora sp. WMMD975]|uniref:cysteine hydrolase family protein n=1 Tax=Micromonospora sp. WMMD975 TaxID=3016087 RepID=UPI00249CD40E|nr:cysteine hydrolase [Micromonospora sp. WMMD975]WFE35204.1 cysteine hydrolase [Micromonospora sp. WMMD975]
MALPPEVADRITVRDTALLVIDMQRRHLDVDGVGYHTLPPEKAREVTARTGEALTVARAAGMPVVHVATWKKAAGLDAPRQHRNPFMAWQNGKPIVGASFLRQDGKCVEGSPYAEFMPATEPLPSEPVVVKHRYSGFYATELELVLRELGVRTLVVAGVNTNNCVLHTSFDAQARDFGVVLLADCCGSMNGDELHRMGLRQIETSVGWLSTVDEMAGLLTVAVAS